MNQWKISGTLGRRKPQGSVTRVTVKTEGFNGRDTYVETVAFEKNGVDFSRMQEGAAVVLSGHIEMRKESILYKEKPLEVWRPQLVVDAADAGGSESADPFNQEEPPF